jgi:hypothetical protein
VAGALPQRPPVQPPARRPSLARVRALAAQSLVARLRSEPALQRVLPELQARALVRPRPAVMSLNRVPLLALLAVARLRVLLVAALRQVLLVAAHRVRLRPWAMPRWTGP